MICVFYDEIDENTGRITRVHFQPDLLTEEEKVGGIEVESYPTPTPQEGKDAISYIDLQTHEITFQYVDRPLSPAELEKKEIQDRLDAAETAINFLLGL